MGKKILCVDFDGVLHSYVSGWQGAEIIADPPVPGAIAFLRAASERFSVAIFSSRSADPAGVEAMKNWFQESGLSQEWIRENLKFPLRKPAAWVTLDDRAIQFTGSFPSLDEIDSFRTWTQLTSPKLDGGALEKNRLPHEVLLCLLSRGSLNFNDRLEALRLGAAFLIAAAADSPEDGGRVVDLFTNGTENAVAKLLNVRFGKK